MAPTDLTVTGSSNGEPITLSWTPIAYTNAHGLLRDQLCHCAGRPVYSLRPDCGQDRQHLHGRLPPRSTPYYFRLRTITEPHFCDPIECVRLSAEHG